MPQPSLFEYTQEHDVSVGPSGVAPELLKDIIERREHMIDKLANGGCKSMESVADAVGFIRAISYVLDYPERKRRSLEQALGKPITNDED